MQFTDLGNGAHLELVQPHHAPEIFELIDTNRAHLREWLPFVDGTQSVEDTKRSREASAQRYARDGSFDAGIFDGGALAGVIGLHWIHMGNRNTSLGYWLGAGFQGRGLMTRSVNAVLEHCFVELDLNRVSSAAAVGNIRSNAVLQRCGFQLEGISREPEWLYDHFVDHNVYGILQRDWQAARGQLKIAEGN
jgi:ribosomal-protein-serine acetyltransferase